MLYPNTTGPETIIDTSQHTTAGWIGSTGGLLTGTFSSVMSPTPSCWLRRHVHADHGDPDDQPRAVQFANAWVDP